MKSVDPRALLTRDEFREAVFQRDQHRCVVCGLRGAHMDAHHLLERRLWPDGGYYLYNGATLCEVHHPEAESTALSVEFLREQINGKVLVPPHLYPDQIYDKWANPILPNGRRMRGELFHDQSVQKVLANYLHLFTWKVKYPRTYHLPWSPGVGKDDRVLDGVELD